MQTIDFVTTSDLSVTRGSFPAGIGASAKYRVLVIAEGSGTISLAGRVAEATRGAVMLLAPYDLLYVPASTHSCIDAYQFTFVPEALYRTEASLTDVFGGETYLHPAQQTGALAALVSRVLELASLPAMYMESFARLYMTELLLHLTAYPIPFDTSLGVARAVKYLAAHLHEDVSLDTLSEAVGISKFYLCRAFSRDSGLTPHAYLNHVRAYRAETLLSGGMSAADAATSVGFGDYSTFFRTYRKIIGRTPTTRESET